MKDQRDVDRGGGGRGHCRDWGIMNEVMKRFSFAVGELNCAATSYEELNKGKGHKKNSRKKRKREKEAVQERERKRNRTSQ